MEGKSKERIRKWNTIKKKEHAMYHFIMKEGSLTFLFYELWRAKQLFREYLLLGYEQKDI